MYTLGTIAELVFMHAVCQSDIFIHQFGLRLKLLNFFLTNVSAANEYNLGIKGMIDAQL